MFEDFIQDLIDMGDSKSSDASTYDARNEPHFLWRCECGASSRGAGWLFESDAQQGADRHQWSKGIHHPAPEVYSASTQ